MVGCAGGAFEHGGSQLAREFSSFVNREGMVAAEVRRPTPFLPPTTVVAAQLDALQRNDWPDTDAGISTAFAFAKPHGCEKFMPGQVLLAIIVPLVPSVQPCSCILCFHAMQSCSGTVANFPFFSLYIHTFFYVSPPFCYASFPRGAGGGSVPFVLSVFALAAFA